MDLNQFVELVCVSVSCTALVAYHIWFVYKILKDPKDTTTGLTYFIRIQWVKETKGKSGGDILAVQTLRNWIIVSTFLASVAVTVFYINKIGFTTLKLAIDMMDVKTSLVDGYIAVDLKSNLLGVKALIVVACNFISFFGFTQSIRYLIHVGFGIQVHLEESGSMVDLQLDDGHGVEKVAMMLNLGALFFTLGVRGFYFAIPFVFWFFSSYALLASTVVLLVAVYYTDSQPSSYPNEPVII